MVARKLLEIYFSIQKENNYTNYRLGLLGLFIIPSGIFCFIISFISDYFINWTLFNYIEPHYLSLLWFGIYPSLSIAISALISIKLVSIVFWLQKIKLNTQISSRYPLNKKIYSATINILFVIFIDILCYMPFVILYFISLKLKSLEESSFSKEKPAIILLCPNLLFSDICQVFFCAKSFIEFYCIFYWDPFF